VDQFTQEELSTLQFLVSSLIDNKISMLGATLDGEPCSVVGITDERADGTIVYYPLAMMLGQQHFGRLIIAGAGAAPNMSLYNRPEGIVDEMGHEIVSAPKRAE
jgi:hypothetical protein